MPTSTPSRPDADRRPRPIAEIARELGLGAEEWIPYGHDKAKVRVGALAARRDRPDGKLVVVSSITPTPAGDGKTTMTIGIGQALWRVGARPVIALREPSIGPTLGMKGGGTGGGKSQVVPMDEINLHFTGDFHAITSAHNLLAAAIDNHLHHGNPLGIDVRQVAWKRILDVNDRALRDVVVGLGGRMDGVPREAGFLITSASEIMAALCLAEDLMDLKQRLGRMLVALTADGKPVTADALGVTGAMAALLRDAIHPNLVQTMEGTPALVHGGPFANIAHGCNSVLATRLALKLGQVLAIKKALVFYRKDLAANREVISSIEKEYAENLDKNLLSKFRLHYADLSSLHDSVSIYHDILSTATEVHLSIVSNNLNLTMKKMTSWGAIILVPSLIAGIYGMNFAHLPLSGTPAGFWVLLGLMAAAVVGLVHYFKKQDWL